MNEERLLNILLKPRLSEKSTHTSGGYRLYVFEVAKDATKPEIRQAVEMLFNVKVHKVRVANVKGKATRFGRVLGRHRDWKKAYVSLHEGQEIDMAAA